MALLNGQQMAPSCFSSLLHLTTSTNQVGSCYHMKGVES
ncbi:hypothetical protein QTP86_021407 [Hemibagrus guttatus]|nr:hypothetical protein QTP86_021407 [Hemibagrus guttatus]